LFTFAPELKKATAILNCVAKYTQPRTGSWTNRFSIWLSSPSAAVNRETMALPW
jgi:hypothetical protein